MSDQDTDKYAELVEAAENMCDKLDKDECCFDEMTAYWELRKALYKVKGGKNGN